MYCFLHKYWMVKIECQTVWFQMRPYIQCVVPDHDLNSLHMLMVYLSCFYCTELKKKMGRKSLSKQDLPQIFIELMDTYFNGIYTDQNRMPYFEIQLLIWSLNLAHIFILSKNKLNKFSVILFLHSKLFY